MGRVRPGFPGVCCDAAAPTQPGERGPVQALRCPIDGGRIDPNLARGAFRGFEVRADSVP
jgi:hypothetical protein